MKLTEKIALFYLKQHIRILAIFSPAGAAAMAFRVFCTPLRQQDKRPSKVFDEAEKLQVEVDGMHLRGYRFNAGGRKKILILHGMHSSARNFERYVQPLVAKGMEVLAFDAPAHGYSDGKQVTVVQYREMIAKIYSTYGPIDGFLSHSFGGLAISLSFEILPPMPESRLVLIAPATETVTAINHYFGFLGLSEKVRQIFDNIIFEKGGRRPDWYSVKRAIPDIKAKILWFHDTKDEVTPMTDMQAIIDADYPNIEFVITENWGHRRIYREQSVIDRSVDFLVS